MTEIFFLNSESQKVNISPPLLLVSPYKEIWERDDSSKKEKAYDDFTFIHFMTDPRKDNVYRNYKFENEPNSEREQKIIESIFQGKYKPDFLVYEGIKARIKDFTENSFNYQYLQAALVLARKSKDNYLNIDPAEKTKSGNLVLKPVDIQRALKELPETIEMLKKQMQTVYEEVESSKRTTRNKQINHFEK